MNSQCLELLCEMSDRVVHFENCVSTLEDENAPGGQTNRDEQSSAENPEHDSQSQGATDQDTGNLEERTERWRSVVKRMQSAVHVRNTVKPFRSRRKTMWRAPAETVDPFIQKFSTRSENRKTTPPKRKSSKSSSHEVHMENVVRNGRCPETIAEIDTKELESDTFSSEVEGYNSLLREIPSVFAPEGCFIYVWSYLVVFAIRYNLWVIILRIAFTQAETEFKLIWLVFDYVCDFIYLVDMVISFRTGYLEEGILVTDSKKIALAYLKSKRFLADTLSILPTDFLFVLYSIEIPLLRLNRLLKSYKSLTIKDLMESNTNYPTFHRVFFLLHLMFVVINWNAGIYFMISRAEGFGTNQWVYPGNNGSLYQQYLKSIYWSTLTLTAIGDLPSPTTNNEFIYTTACYLCGVFMFATIVGNAGSIIVNRNASRVDFERQRESTKYYMQKNNVPKDLQRRVLMWYDYTWIRGRVGNTSGDLNSLTLLPDKLKTEIALHVNLETLSKVTFLQKCQPEFLHDLVLKMKLRIFTPGDYICRSGEVAREMFVIINGKIEVVGESGQVLKVLSGGDFFGEIGILSLSEGQNRRTADIRTIGYVECFVLSKDDVLNATRDYPEAQAVLAEYGRRRLEGQNRCKDPRLVDMEDCRPTGSLKTLQSKDASHVTLPTIRDSPMASTTSFQIPTIRTLRAGLLDPISSRPIPTQERIIAPILNQTAQSNTTEDDAILEMMMSSCQEMIGCIKDSFKRQAELENKTIRAQSLALRKEILEKNEENERMKSLLSTQESEVKALRNAVHELEEKQFQDNKQIQRLKNDTQSLRCLLQTCTCRTWPDKPDGTMC